jgi:HSF-type DNA-binding
MSTLIVSFPLMLTVLSFDRSDDGTEILIYDKEKMASTICPRYCTSQKIKSFIRQLNIYGFRKIKSKNRGSDCIYHHEYFQKDQTDLLEYIQRNVPPPTIHTNANDISKLKEKIETILSDVAQLKKEIIFLKQENADLKHQKISLHANGSPKGPESHHQMGNKESSVGTGVLAVSQNVEAQCGINRCQNVPARLLKRQRKTTQMPPASMVKPDQACCKMSSSEEKEIDRNHEAIDNYSVTGSEPIQNPAVSSEDLDSILFEEMDLSYFDHANSVDCELQTF